MISLEKRLELARMILQLAQVSTDNGVLICEGEIVEGVEVFVEGEDGNLIPAPDGDYTTSEYIYKVEGGKVAAVTAVAEPTEPTEPAEPTEPMEDERDARIAELEAANAELTSQLEAANARIAELEAQLAEANTKIEQAKLSVDKPAEKKLDEEVNPALRIMGAK